ncbi:MAG: esterase/lipase family protein [Paracoccaceae bacterium]
MPSAHPVIVVPGVTASYLRDLYPLPPETIWAVIRKNYERVQLHPDDTRYEARQPAVVRPDQLYEIAYEELIEELRHNLAEREDDPVPVFPFSYDWRQPLHVIEASLADFVDEVIDRTGLMRNYHADRSYRDAPKVNLVGHSMGGLAIAGYLDGYGADKINKIATLATPYKGSFEAMVKMVTGTANIGGSTPSSREREAARLTPSLYHLLPSFDTGITRQPDAELPDSTFDPALWQPSIIDTIVEYVRLHGVSPRLSIAAREKRGRTLFDGLLAQAGGHRARIDGLDLNALGFDAGRWLCVVGVGSKTRVRMLVERDDAEQPVFRLTSKDRLNRWGHNSDSARKLTGDGTVHFKGAVPEFLPYESLVCVSPEDYGYWELADANITKLAGFHGILPNMNMLHRLLVRHFTGRPDKRGNTWGRPPPGISADGWKPPLELMPK